MTDIAYITCYGYAFLYIVFEEDFIKLLKTYH